jgi:hypothetical protein
MQSNFTAVSTKLAELGVAFSLEIYCTEPIASNTLVIFRVKSF